MPTQIVTPNNSAYNVISKKTSLPGNSPDWDIDVPTSSYDNLRIIIGFKSSKVSVQDTLKLFINGVTDVTKYLGISRGNQSGAPFPLLWHTDNISLSIPGNDPTVANYWGNAVIDIFEYQNSSRYKYIQFLGTGITALTSSTDGALIGTGQYLETTPITRVVFEPDPAEELLTASWYKFIGF